VQYGALALCDFLAKDEVGKNEVATAVAATARINFLIVFIVSPFAKAPTMLQTGQNASTQGHFSMGRVLHQLAAEPTIALMKSRRRDHRRANRIRTSPTTAVPPP
jgi:hypothetical protein